MTDYFALLDQPRAPWLDSEELKEAFHAKSLRAHPDARPPNADAGPGADFAQLNEGYQVLRDPRRRLQHLLSLEGAAAETAAVPKELEDLFPAVAAVTQRADAVLQKTDAASNALSRSLVRPELIATLTSTDEILKTLRDLFANANSDLRKIDKQWAVELPALQLLYLRFSYLTRWVADLEEKQARLRAAK